MISYVHPFRRGLKVQASKPPEGRYAHENHPESRYAIDFLLPLGDPILASADGEVAVAKHDSDMYISDMAEMKRMSIEQLIEFAERYTNCVCIYHDDGTFAEYSHLDTRAVVAEGQKVEQGQVIGYCGMSGLTTEPHLHFNRFKVIDGKAISIPVEFSE